MTTSRSRMDNLPLELIHIICAFLFPCDISSFRLVSKAFAKLAEPHLVRELHVMLEGKSLQNLLNISKHPSLRNYVTRITYEVRYLGDVDITAYSVNVIDNEHENEDQDDEPTHTRIQNGWRIYHRKLEEQKFIRMTCYDT